MPLLLKRHLKETVNLASSHGLIDLNIICTDGSKIKANANKKRSLTEEQVKKLDLVIDKMIEEDIKQDEIDEKMYWEKEENLTNLEDKNLREIVKVYRKNKNKAGLKKKCVQAKGEFQKDFEMKRVSLTDPDCRMMQNKKGTSELDYNVQFTVDSKNQIIPANDVCQDRTDRKQLQLQVKQVKENIGLKKGTKIAADCNYNSGQNLNFLENEHLDGYIPTLGQAQEFDDREITIKEDCYKYDQEKDIILFKGRKLRYFSTWTHGKNKKYRIYKSRDGTVTKKVIEFFREGLRMKVGSDTGKVVYNIRKFIIEPVIGNIKYNMRFDEFSLRGLEKVKLDLNLASIVHNLKKVWLKKIEMYSIQQYSHFCLIIEK
ncbi:MAG: transposase [Candidatus Woesearchaeota archaeon]